MSGHSKWSTIKRKKGATDAKRGAIFTKVANLITITARAGGGDPNSNTSLSDAIAKAKEVNMPKDNIERAIKRGTGEIEGVTIEELRIEAYGPGGSAFIIDAITDNKNRTISEIRNILSTHGGKIAEAGSVSYQFSKKGVIIVGNHSEEMELMAIDAGANDTKIDNGKLLIYTDPKVLQTVKGNLKDAKIESAEIEMVPKNPLSPSPGNKTKIEKLANTLTEYNDVNDVYSNA